MRPSQVVALVALTIGASLVLKMVFPLGDVPQGAPAPVMEAEKQPIEPRYDSTAEAQVVEAQVVSEPAPTRGRQTVVPPPNSPPSLFREPRELGIEYRNASSEANRLFNRGPELQVSRSRIVELDFDAFEAFIAVASDVEKAPTGSPFPLDRDYDLTLFSDLPCIVNSLRNVSKIGSSWGIKAPCQGSSASASLMYDESSSEYTIVVQQTNIAHSLSPLGTSGYALVYEIDSQTRPRMVLPSQFLLDGTATH